MLDPELLKIIYDDEEYDNHAESFNDNAEDSNSRYNAWYSEHKSTLKEIYKNGVDEDDAIITEMPFTQWAQDMFICWDYNTKQQRKLQDDINWELQFQSELKAMGI